MFRHQVEAGVLLENRCRCPELVKRQHPIEEGAAQRRKNTAHGASRGWKNGMTQP